MHTVREGYGDDATPRASPMRLIGRVPRRLDVTQLLLQVQQRRLGPGRRRAAERRKEVCQRPLGRLRPNALVQGVQVQPERQAPVRTQ